MHPVPAPAPVRAQGVIRRYGRTVALNGVDLAIRPGEVTALLGPNGAGKTSFVELVLGGARPDAGTIEVLGHAPGTRSARLASGVMLQSATLAPQLTVAEHAGLYAGYYGNRSTGADLLAAAGIAGLAARRYGQLSGGQQRCVQFALATGGAPRLLVLDEPTAAMDADARRRCWNRVRELAATGAAALLTTHLLEEAEALADRIVVLAAGRVIADGTPGDIRARVAEQGIRCRTVLTAADLGRLPGVLAASAEAGRALLRTRSAEVTLRALFAADPDLAELEVTRASLEAALSALLVPEAA